ncbi:DUF4148 domain-containing protein [Paraburkholderia sp. CNPSo 3274]|uniref:DUF4148 domain-containing protein n=1 Tax=Paraburkholderia sp. CNPSo 3274 TaxID=2940932 RepID=UPI0020B78F28|nr:DUF4148 domain-containing protein [Paraburkholderia sp. CNPSo 3274]MCP3711815.1 DUF4148 domain-containing protein [Paraburkholderia sp. CNPSo 3274]
MNANAIVSRTALATLLISVAVAAQAQAGDDLPPEQSTLHSVQVSSAGPVDPGAQIETARVDGRVAANVGPVPGKTRAQVRADLLQAGEEGMLPLRWVDYPPSAATRTRNRENYLLLEQVWKEEGTIPATSVSKSSGFN